MDTKKLTVDDIEVPEGMLEAAQNAEHQCHPYLTRNRLKAALLWLAENPIVPSDTDTKAIVQQAEAAPYTYNRFTYYGAVEWQRRMFLKPVPVIPEEVQALCDTWREKSLAGTAKPVDAVYGLAHQIYELGKRASQEGK